MASYHLSVKTVSRATGRSGPGAAAYRTASRIECERDGTTHDYTRRSGVEASFIVAPPGAEWAQDRAVLWNAVEAAEKRKDAKVAREYELALPHELAPEDRRTLVESFAHEVVARFGVVADVAIHAPHRHGDERNWHAHVLTTTRIAEARGLSAKTRELDVVQTSGPAVEALRELWAVQVNHALERIQSEARVDHRSYARQGGDQVASQHLGPAAAAMERKAARRSAEQAREEARSAPEPRQEATRPVLAPVEAPQPRQGQEAAQDAPERVREASRPVPASGPVQAPPDAPEAAIRPPAGVSGAGLEPATRIGQRNSEIQERNRAVQAARAALDVARRALEGLERAAAAGRCWVAGLARGLGAQIAGEREERAQEMARQREAEELARQEAARRAERVRQAAITQGERDAARARSVWDRAEEAGRKAREADRARLGLDHERRGERQGPGMGR